MAKSNDFIGRGWGFPIRLDPNGSLALVSREREISEAIRIILGTTYGERPMRPDFGCLIHDMVFDPVNPATMALMAYEVQRSLERWEPRITVEGVDVQPDVVEESTVYIDISYSINATNSTRNLVFPFYMIPEGRE